MCDIRFRGPLSATALWACLLAPLSLAQGFTMPAGYENTTNDPAAALFPPDYQLKGATSEVQLCYGSHQGSNKVLVVKRLSFRRETAKGATNYARSWSNVTLNVGDCDFTKLSDYFSANLAKPTTVFSAAVAWPGTTGKPATDPPPWGKFAGTAYDVSFPFSSSFVHTGKLGFCADFQFSGGKLANNSVVWTDYYVAGVADTQTTTLNPQKLYGGRQCKATGQTTASVYSVWMYSNNIPGGKKQFRHSIWAEYYPSNALVMGALTLFGSTVATPFPGSCRGLFLDVSKPMVVQAHKADAGGLVPGPYSNVNYNPAFVNTTIWAQAAFMDVGVLQLSRAVTTTITAPPAGTPQYGVRLYATALGGYQPGGWGDLFDNNVPIIYLH